MKGSKTRISNSFIFVNVILSFKSIAFVIFVILKEASIGRFLIYLNNNINIDSEIEGGGKAFYRGGSYSSTPTLWAIQLKT